MDGWFCWAETPPDGRAAIEWIRHKEGVAAYVQRGRGSEVASMLRAHRADLAAIFWRPACSNVVGVKPP